MGGEREDTIEQKAAPVMPVGGVIERGVMPVPPADYQKLRFHENGGEVHFHDDARGLKWAIRVALWHNLYSELEAGKAFSHRDSKNQTLLTGKLVDGDAVLELTASPLAGNGPTMQALAKFTNG